MSSTLLSALENENREATLQTTTKASSVMAFPFRTAKRWPAPKPARDYSKQLDLFGEIASDVSAQRGSTPAPAMLLEAPDGRENPAGTNDSQALARTPAAMVLELEKNGQLQQALSEAQERTADLLFELLSVRKIEYQEAWEIATREWAFLPTGGRPQESSSDSTLNPSAPLSATCE